MIILKKKKFKNNSVFISDYVLRTIIQGKLHQSYKSLTQSFTICNKSAVTTALDPVPITV